MLLGGKVLKESLEAYKSMAMWTYEQLKPYFPRNPALNRNGALVLALHDLVKRAEKGELVEHAEKGEHSLRLVGYERVSLLADEAEEPEVLIDIEAAEERVVQMHVHFFEFELDGKRIRVSVHRTKVRMRKEGEHQRLLPDFEDIF